MTSSASRSGGICADWTAATPTKLPTNWGESWRRWGGTKNIAVAYSMSLLELHQFELALIDPCLAMTARGLRVDDKVRRAMMEALASQAGPITKAVNERLAVRLAATSVAGCYLFDQTWRCPACHNGKKKKLDCAECGGDGRREWREFNLASEQQKKIVLYEILKLPRRQKGGKLRSDEDALKGLLVHDETGTVQDLLRHAKLSTMQSILTRLEPAVDGRIRTWYNIAGTETGRFSSSETFLERSCLTGDSEVLTRDGWIRLDALNGTNAEVMQWNPTNNELSWCINSPITRAAYTGELVKSGSWFHKHKYTTNHRIPCMSYKHERVEVLEADEASRLTNWKLPLAGHFRGGTANVTIAEARLLAAFQADGSYFANDTAARWQFTKPRKAQRIRKLLRDARWEWTKNATPKGAALRIRVPKVYSRLFVTWLGKEKLFGSWLLSWPYDVLKAFVDETKYWDATRVGNSWRYFTVKRCNAEWLATTAHLVGYSASIRVSENRARGSYGEHSAQPLYQVTVKPRDKAVCTAKQFSRERFSGTVYCVTTATSFFLTRCSERIVVTGNTNLQNLPLKQAARSPLYDVRRCVVPDDGECFLYADLSQAEARVVAALSGDGGLLERWGDADFDVHRWTASHIFSKPITEVTSNERHLGKVARHALNYAMGWARFQQNVNGDADITGVAISAADAKRIVGAYHKLHPKLEDWWRAVAGALDTRGCLETIFGRKRTFFGRRETDRWLDGTHKEAIAFTPQSTVADLLNRGLLRWWQHYDRHVCNGCGCGQLQAHVHDALLIGCTERAAFSGVIRQLRECLEEEIIVNGIKLTIPCKVEIGRASWAALEDAGAITT